MSNYDDFTLTIEQQQQLIKQARKDIKKLKQMLANAELDIKLTNGEIEYTLDGADFELMYDIIIVHEIYLKDLKKEFKQMQEEEV